MPKAVKKAAKKVAKRVAKKAPAKKAAKKVVRRKRAEKPTAESVAEQVQVETLNQAAATGAALHQGFAEAMQAEAAELGQFSAAGMLDLNIRSSIQAARGEVVRSIRNLVQASIDLSDSASASQSARNVATAQQRLAVAQVELALDGLENAVRS